MDVPTEKPLDLWTDDEFIQAFGAEAKRQAPKPLFLGDLQRSGWTGKIPTYLVYCAPCRFRPGGGFTVAHEAGYGRRLECAKCRRRYEGQLLVRRLGAWLAGLNPLAHPGSRFFLFILVLCAAVAALIAAAHP